VLVTGLEHEPVPPPPGAPPGTPPLTPAPDPPPLMERGAKFLDEQRQGIRPLELPLPYAFGP